MALTDLGSASPLAPTLNRSAGSWFGAVLAVLYYVYFYSLCFVWCVPVFIMGVVLRPWDPDKRVCHFLTRSLAFHLIAFNPRWRMQFENIEYYDKSKAYVVVANHQSMADVLVLSGLGGFYKWIAKAQIFAMPGVGHLLQLNDCVCVSHGSLSSVRNMMRATKAYLQKRITIFVFPEGTRSEDGALMAFKEGPFRLAVETGTAVLPVVIEGTRDILPRGSWIVNFQAEIRVRLLEPIEVEGWNANQLCAEVRRRIEENLDAMRTGDGIADEGAISAPSGTP